MDAKKYVYFFGDGIAEGSARMKSLLGSKGANLAEMVNIDIPVPPGFTISTEACTHYMQTMVDTLSVVKVRSMKTPLAVK